MPIIRAKPGLRDPSGKHKGPGQGCLARGPTRPLKPRAPMRETSALSAGEGFYFVCKTNIAREPVAPLYPIFCWDIDYARKANIEKSRESYCLSTPVVGSRTRGLGSPR